jgi:cysteine sulfinate desulfinase/cysteine desulfurase-like protein
MGLPAAAALASVRVSLGRGNSAAEVDEFVATIADIVADLDARAA